MKNIRTALITICMLPVVASATPQKIEMVFLSPEKVSMIIELLDKYQVMKMSSHLSQNDMDNCLPMGDGCFNPQYGYIEKKFEAPKNEATVLEDKKFELKTFNAVDTSMINCDKNNYFDIFCGKETANAAPSELEIWFDISSSLRTVDYNKDPDQCARRSFMEKVMASCKSKVNVSIYNTSLKQIGDHSNVCMAYGMNDEAKLVKWMKDSKARHLLLVTDIDEMSVEMRDFLSSNGAKMTGDGTKAFTSKDLIDYAKEFTKMCR
ncbi:MAG: hypothetical protein H7336_00110 [Bacteriovorax sp.]|nr:hypothetical protein [Bacteriovorax sp.]